MKKAIVLLLIAMIACTAPPQETPQPEIKPLTGIKPSGITTTQDGQTIAYQYYQGGSTPVILLHMLKRTRNDWDSVAKWLQKNGYTVIVPDLRGHGQSTGNWEQFTTEDFNKMANDVAAAKSVLESKGADTKKLTIIGASIGANVAYNYAIQDRDVKTVVLLSPGLEYKGIKIDPSKLGKPFMIVASNDDSYSAATAQEFKTNPSAHIKMYEDAGHGTNMFQKNDLAPAILNWIKGNT